MGNPCAAANTVAAAGVARRIGERYPKLHVDGSKLIALQTRAHVEWRDSFNVYLTRIGASRPLVTEERPIG